MSATVTYSFKIADDTIAKVVPNTSFSADNKSVQSFNIINTDSPVTIDLTELVNVKAVFISSAQAITATINGQAIALDDFLFMKVTALTSLTITTAETTKHLVEVILWGSD